MSDFSLYISDAAVKRLKEIKKNKGETTFLRLEVISGGCHGFNTKFSLNTNLEESDIQFNQDGITFTFVGDKNDEGDKILLDTINGSTIEYSSSLMGSFFWLNVKSAKGTCSCGSSFSLDIK
ncbi:HesB/IscA family protein [Rickettsiales bacterium LUAb2]